MKLSSLSLSYIRSQMGPNATNYEASLLLAKVADLSQPELEGLSSSQWVQLVQEAVTEAESRPMPIPQPVRRWEYKLAIKSLQHQDEGFLNKQGYDGWEMCGRVQYGNVGVFFYFKRELQ